MIRQPMTAGVRKLALSAHVATSAGWLGAVAVLLLFAIVPLSLASLPTGLLMSLGTEYRPNFPGITHESQWGTLTFQVR